MVSFGIWCSMLYTGRKDEIVHGTANLDIFLHVVPITATVKMVANIPFNISTDVIKQLLPMGDLIFEVLLLQEEAALRLVDPSLSSSEYRPVNVSSTFTQVLGAAMFYVKVGDSAMVYTGDYNMTPDRHLGAAQIDRLQLDVVVSESTYATTFRDSKLTEKGNF